jgi:peptidoglycan/xylan/chitin deacetylase (PgdA/CDA1 family)
MALRLLQALCSNGPASALVCWRAPRARRQVALTFDDGPNPTFTPQVLDILRGRHVRGTFFVEGRWVQAHPQLVKRIVDEGHEIGNHGVSHDDRRATVSQVALCGEALAACGVATRIFRPPFGRVRTGDILRVAARGYTTVLWSVDTRDSMRHEGRWRGAAPDYRALRPGDIVLLHDDNPVCLDELPRILAAAGELSLQPVTVSELMGFCRANCAK